MHALPIYLGHPTQTCVVNILLKSEINIFTAVTGDGQTGLQKPLSGILTNCVCSSCTLHASILHPLPVQDSYTAQCFRAGVVFSLYVYTEISKDAVLDNCNKNISNEEE